MSKKPKNMWFIVNEDGRWGMLFKGHGHDKERIVAEAAGALGEPGEELEVVERFYQWVPRIKNCADHPSGSGFGCDDEGEWHGHWFEVARTEDPKYHFTEVRAT